MTVLAKEYRSPQCRVSIRSYRVSEVCSKKTGCVIVYRDETNECWKIRVEVISSKQAVFNLRLRDQIKTVTLLKGTRLNVGLVKNNASIIAECLCNDSDSITAMKALEFALKKIKADGDPPSNLVKHPVMKIEEFSVDQVVNMVSDENDDDGFTLFEGTVAQSSPEKRKARQRLRAGRLLSPRSSDASGVPARHSPYSVANSHNNNLGNDDKENKLSESELLKAKSFYNSDLDVSHSRSPLLEMVKSSNPREETVVSKQSFRKPGLLPSPNPRSKSHTQSSKRSSPPASQKTEYSGFSNLGNTCYMNAVLQCLLGLPPFCWDLLQNTANDKFMKHDQVCRSLLVLYHAKCGNCTVENEHLRDVKHSIALTANRFSGFGQHDAQEFLIVLLDQLHEEIQTGISKADSDTEWSNPVIPNFQIQVKQLIKCLGCSNVVSKIDPLYELSVEVPNIRQCGTPGSIQSSVDGFFTSETVDYRCEQCGHAKSVVEHKIARLPRIIIVHLKRWCLNEETHTFDKVTRSAFVPSSVTLSEHCDVDTCYPDPPVNPYPPKPDKEVDRRGRRANSQVVPDRSRTSSNSSSLEISDEGCEVKSSPIVSDVDADDDLIRKVKYVSRLEYENGTLRTNSSLEEERNLNLALQMSLNESQIVDHSQIETTSFPNSSTPSCKVKHCSKGEGDTPCIHTGNSILKSLDTPPGSDRSRSDSGDARSVPVCDLNCSDRSESKDSQKTCSSIESVGLNLECSSGDVDDVFTCVSPLNDYRESISRRDDAGVRSDSSEDEEILLFSNTGLRWSGKRVQSACVGLNGGRRSWSCYTGSNDSEDRCRNCENLSSECQCYEGDFEISRRNDTEPSDTTSDRNTTRSTADTSLSEFNDHETMSRNSRQKTTLISSDSSSSSTKSKRSCPSSDERPSRRNLSFEEEMELACRMSLMENYKKNEDDDYLKAIERSKTDTRGRGVDDDDSELCVSGRVNPALVDNSDCSDEAGVYRVSDTSLPLSPLKIDRMMASPQRASIKRSPYRIHKLSPISDANSSERSNKSVHVDCDEAVYELVSVVEHLGRSQFAGHYVANVRDPRNDWIHFDDSIVTKTSLSEVRDRGGSNGYIFFYQAKSVTTDVLAQTKRPVRRTVDVNDNYDVKRRKRSDFNEGRTNRNR